MPNKDIIKLNKVNREIRFEFSEDGSLKNQGKPIEINEYDKEGKLNGYISEENQNRKKFYNIRSFDKERNQIDETFFDCKNFINGYPHVYERKQIDITSHDNSYYKSKTWDYKGKMIRKYVGIKEIRWKAKEIRWEYVYDENWKLKSKYITKFHNNKESSYTLEFNETTVRLNKNCFTYYYYNNKPHQYDYDRKGHKFKEISKMTDERYMKIGETIIFKDTVTWKFDKTGKLIKRIRKDEEGEKSFIYTFYYDDKCNKIKELSKNANGEVISEKLWEYYDNGLIKSHINKDNETKSFKGVANVYEYYE